MCGEGCLMTLEGCATPRCPAVSDECVEKAATPWPSRALCLPFCGQGLREPALSVPTLWGARASKSLSGTGWRVGQRRAGRCGGWVLARAAAPTFSVRVRSRLLSHSQFSGSVAGDIDRDAAFCPLAVDSGVCDALGAVPDLREPLRLGGARGVAPPDARPGSRPVGPGGGGASLAGAPSNDSSPLRGLRTGSSPPLANARRASASLCSKTSCGTSGRGPYCARCPLSSSWARAHDASFARASISAW